MSLPYFFVEELPSVNSALILDEENSRHIVQVLRMQPGDALCLLNGNGIIGTAVIADAHKKHCMVNVRDLKYIDPPQCSVTIAISLLKNTSRFEWFVEKAVEIGVKRIVPLICLRTEKQKFRADRVRSILISAMMQSQQAWLPEISEPVQFREYIRGNFDGQIFIAHCRDDEHRNPVGNFPGLESTILIGPEGDFSPEEIEAALRRNFIPVSLGSTRLRTETAGMVAAALLCRHF